MARVAHRRRDGKNDDRRQIRLGDNDQNERAERSEDSKRREKYDMGRGCVWVGGKKEGCERRGSPEVSSPEGVEWASGWLFEKRSFRVVEFCFRRYRMIREY